MQSFVIWSDEIEGRFDPFSYTPQIKSFLNTQTKSKYAVKLGSIISSGSYGILPPSDCYAEGGEVLLVRATELKPDLGIDLKNSIPVPDIFYESERARLRKNDILLAVKGATIASNKSVCFVDDEPPKSIVNGSIFRFQVKEGINSKYVAIALCLETSKKQMNMLLIANNAVNYLDRNIINNLLISLPPISIQSRIVEIMQSALEQKKQQEAEAQRLLDSIDDFILDELEIRLPKTKKQMCYVISTDEIINRLDPYYYKSEFRIDFGKYEVKKFEDIFESITDGDHGNPEYSKEGIPFLRVVDVANDALLEKNLLRISADYSKRLYESCFAKEDDWLISIVGTIGKTLIVDKQYLPIAISRGFAILTPQKQNNINYEYVHSFSKSQLFLNQLERNRVGSVQSGVYLNSVRNLKIPLPPLEIQNKIAEEVKRRISEAERLKAEAGRIIEEAKKKVDEMILGE